MMSGTYIDLNMVRAGTCDHPQEWKTCGYHELAEKRQRYRIINQERVQQCLRVENQNQFQDCYRATLEEKLSQDCRVREPIWSEAMAAGSESWINGLSIGLLAARAIPYRSNLGKLFHEPQQTYGLHISKREKEHYWKKQQDLS